MTKRKPVAYFKGVNGWTDMKELGVRATLYGVQHPKLGSEDIVYTTKVHQIHWDEEEQSTKSKLRTLSTSDEKRTRMSSMIKDKYVEKLARVLEEMDKRKQPTAQVVLDQLGKDYEEEARELLNEELSKMTYRIAEQKVLLRSIWED